ncbi:MULTISPECIES: hypothetical protein [unclassified Brevundimonas]|uniref:hypothetical protein n=1 Tax=unclassified Brevundimonas TaxID=2622653 RepID=UPI0025BB4C39|nr:MULTISPECIES: hypothetical protein [unclassified Brevundimonas]
MLEAIGALIGLAGMLLFLVAIVCLIRPIRAIKLGTRKRAGLALLASIALFTMGGLILPEPTPEQIAQREAAAAQATADREKRNEQRAAERAAEEGAREEREAAALAQQKPAMTAAAKTLWEQVSAQASPCDVTGKNLADYMGRRGASVYEAYDLARQASRICSETGTNIGRLRVSDDIPSSKRGAFSDAVETCRNAYYAKSSAFDQMATVLNGDMRPSAVADARQAAERSQAGTTLCGLAFLKAVNDAGLSLEDVMGEEFAGQ